MVRSALLRCRRPLACLLLAGTTWAQVPPESRPKAPEPSPAPVRRRAISPEVAAQLSTFTPKFSPPPPKPAPTTSDGEKPDLRETDRPQNGIIRLPTVVVEEPRTPVLRERTVNTKKGLTGIAMRRYISDADRALNRYTLPLFGTSAESRALAMYAEDERLQNQAELRDNASTAAKSDPAAGAYIRREADKMYLRTSDFGWNGGGPK